jgi:hypothetical protein
MAALKALFSKLEDLNDQTAGYTAAAESTGDWDTAFSLVFSPALSQRVFALARELGSSLDYYDPDTTYEEDVRAFAGALDDKVHRLRPFHGPLVR